MKAKFSSFLMVLCAILAFAPILTVDYMLDEYVRVREGKSLQAQVRSIINETQGSVNKALTSLNAVITQTPSLCTPTFLKSAAKQMRANSLLRQLVVNSPDGNVLCSAYGTDFKYTTITPTMTMPTGPQEMSIVRIEDAEQPLIKVSIKVRPGREVSAFVPINVYLLVEDSSTIRGAVMTRYSLTTGLAIVEFGDPEAYYGHPDRANEFLFAEQVAQNVPIKLSSALPMEVVRAGYTDLKIGFIIVACLTSCVFLWLCVQYVRRSQAPTFDLERAIQAGELRPRYQPVIDLQTGHIAGCEVLIRWEKPNGEIISPGAFIEYAELSGLAIPMTLSLMEQVRDDLEDLCARHPHLKIGINLFERHFRDGSIVEDVQAIFGGTEVRYSQLVFEITERQPLSDMEGVNKIIDDLRNLGAKVALDDAGTGHSNLAYIQKLGIDIVKIDRVFVELIRHRNVPVPVVDALIGMANELQTEIIAEGVETEEQALYLRSKGIRQAQGFLFAPALPIDSYLALAERMNNEEVKLIDDFDDDDLVAFDQDDDEDADATDDANVA